MKRSLFLWLLLWSSPFFAQSQANASSEIYHDLLRLQKNASVMYLAAHPDDENTKIISWLTHQQYLDAVYLSLTRGDGGQNLIGNEQGEMLGLLRTQELLEARKIDHGRQWFSRAIDFGYSKTATETLQIWDKQQVLSDVVWAIRVNQPQVIITRFDPASNGKTHGHHTASALLAMEAYDLAADPTAFPEQLKYVDIWQVKRMFFNTSWWFYGSQQKFEEADKTGMFSIDVGSYYPLLGISNNEISALSRSKHACQGFGMALERGSQLEWLRLLKGDRPTDNNILQGIDLGWKQKDLQNQIDKVIANFDFKQPENSSKELVKFYQMAQEHQVDERKLQQIKNIILEINGVYMEWTTSLAFATEGENITTNLEIAHRGNSNESFSAATGTYQLKPNSNYTAEFKHKIQAKVFSTPYWLVESPEGALYSVKNQQDIGQPELPLPPTYPISLNIDGATLTYELALQQKWVDPALGELYEPFYVLPKYVVNFGQENYIFNKKEKAISVEVQGFASDESAEVTLEADSNWQVSPAQKFSQKQVAQKHTFSFKITPKTGATTTQLKAKVRASDGQTYSQALEIVDYEHIQRQIRLKEASVELKNLSLETPKVNIAYIQGSGDVVPDNLREIGLDVHEIDIQQWNSEMLENVDVLMLGIRAYNTIEALAFIQQDIFKFINNGGVVIVQYNTNRGLVTDDLAPYPLTIGRDRIAEETADLTMLQPKHRIWQYPNQITSKDFDHWVQERGLYFVSEWDSAFMPFLEGHDTDETRKQGILLVADYGQGHFVYTGISFFRQLPAGVPGAYRLLMNLLALGEK